MLMGPYTHKYDSWIYILGHTSKFTNFNIFIVYSFRLNRLNISQTDGLAKDCGNSIFYVPRDPSQYEYVILPI